MTAAERMRRMRLRRKAAGLKEVIAWVPSEPITQPRYSTHRLLEARKHGLTDKSTLLARLKETALTRPERSLIGGHIKRDFAGRAPRI